MKVVFTKHAKDRMGPRGITTLDIRDMLISAKSELLENELIKLHAQLRNKALTIIIKKQENILTILTMYWRK